MKYVEAKAILNSKNELNLYKGCSFGCLYCEAQNKYGCEMEANINAPRQLSLELSLKHERKIITIGSISDPYNLYEEELKLTRESLKAIKSFGDGVVIFTKSNLILRDLDLLKEINKNAKCTVVISLPTVNDHLGFKLEPKAAAVSERIKTLKMLKEEGISTMVKISPLLPYINDKESNLKEILEVAKDCECKGIIYYGPGIMLRDSSKKYLYERLKEVYPILEKRYIREFKGKNYLLQECNVQSFDYIIKDFCMKNNLMYEMDEISYYLKNFDIKNLQLSLFEN